MIGYDSYKNFLDTFIDLFIKKEESNLLSVVVYGSVARGTANKQSDIDLLIILKDAPESYYERLRPFLEIQQKLLDTQSSKILQKEGFQPYISALILSEEEAKVNRYLFLDMIEDAKILHDPKSFFSRRLVEFKKRIKKLGAKKVIRDDGSWYWDLKPDLKLGEVFAL